MSDNTNDMDLLKFCVSSPGKVILHGEHSVVYGKPALAGVIGERNYLNFEELPSTALESNFQSLNFSFSITIDRLNKLLATINQKAENLDLNDLLMEITQFVNNDLKTQLEGDARKEKSLISFFLLLIGILKDHKISKLKNGFKIILSSKLSIGAGLGSSASFGVCLAAAFYLLSKKLNAKYISTEFTSSELDFVSQWAFNSEKVMHGSPSGIDNTICTFGNIVKFAKGQKPIPVAFKSKLNILLVNSKVNRSTANLVAKVSALKTEYPKLFEHILNGFEEVVNETVKIYENLIHEIDENDKLCTLFQINNDLLKAIGVSHPKLEIIFSIATKHNFASKLTGAGGGGYAIILLPQNFKEMSSFKSLCNDLNDSGFEWFETTVGGKGLEFIIL